MTTWCRGAAVLAVTACSLAVVDGTASASSAPLLAFGPAHAMPVVPGGSRGLAAVSCPEPRQCLAVGSTATGRAGWTVGTEGAGTWHWSSFSELAPGAFEPDVLMSVSCPTRASCVAVGYAEEGSGPNAWTTGDAITESASRVGRTWRFSGPDALPAGATGVDRLMGVACPTATSCVAVGVDVANEAITTAATLVGGHWRWSAATAVAPGSLGTGELLAVSCVSRSSCLAVGDDASSHSVGAATGDGVTTIGTERGRAWSWTPESAVTPDATGTTRLTSVSCEPGGRCEAVGVDANDAGVAVHGASDSVWSSAELLGIGPSSRLDGATGVSCAARLCVAVGVDASGAAAFSEAPGPAASAWGPVRALVGGLTALHPFAVWCALPDECVQVGTTLGGTNVGVATMAPPLPVRDVRGAPGNGHATVVWAPPLFDGGARVVRFEVRSVPGGRSCAVGVASARTKNSCVVDGLVNGARYRFVVTAVNALGPSTPRVSTRPTSPTAFQPPVASPFSRAVRQLIAAQPDELTASVYDVLTGQRWTMNPASVQHTASIVKVEILATLLYDEQQRDEAMPSSTRALATEMIEASNNDAAQALFVQVGQAPGLASFSHLIGLTGTTPNWAWGYTDTTALDQAKIVGLFATPNKILDAASRAFGVSLMRHVAPEQAWGVSAGPAGGATVALKNGWYPTEPGAWQVNSIGWVVGDHRDYVIAILTKRDASFGTGVSSVEAVSRALWDGLAPLVRPHRR